MGNICSSAVTFCAILASIDFWLVRYQGILVGAVALYIASQQMKIARRQSHITQEQYKMATDQRKTEKAIAIIGVDRFLDAAMMAHGKLLGKAGHSDSGEREDGWSIWNWKPETLQVFDRVPLPNDFDVLAIKAFPESAPALSQLFKAVSDASALAKEFATEPWLRASDNINAEFLKKRDLEKSLETDRTLNRVHRFANVCGRLQAYARSAA